MSCPTHAQLVDYWTADGDESIEEHLFSCAACTAEMERIERVVAVFRDSMPPVISAMQLAELRGAGLALGENQFVPGVRQDVTFGPGLDLLIHHLAGLSLADARRVSVTVRVESSGLVIHEEPIAPFDRERGEVLIACQRHFASFPPDVAFDVRVYREAAEPELATYLIPHVY